MGVTSLLSDSYSLYLAPLDERTLEEIGFTSDCEASMKQCQRWLTMCVDGHPECRATNGKDVRPPKRLVDVGQVEETKIHLRTTSSESQPLSYATLSHCWGQSQHLLLTAETYSEFSSGIALVRLPRTFRDAVVLTRRLGIQYLWIDSMCILQDSEQDWREQSAIMGEVYRNSLVNIAATSAHDGDGGLFFDRKPAYLQALQITARWPFDDHLKEEKLYNFFYNSPFCNSILTAALNTRGWVMQERLLSPRIIHCHRNYLAWECRKVYATEEYPDGIKQWIDDGHYPEDRFLNHLEKVKMHPTTSLPEYRAEIHSTWLKIIEQYSACNLTKKSDRLVAISGLAKLVQEELDDR